jgi:hypothetical protein
MKLLLLALVPIATLAVPSLARADQCQLYDAATARRVDQLLAEGPKLVELCEPCGDKAPGLPFTVSRFVHGERDLAYTYVQTSNTRYENLAMLVDCPVRGVSPSLVVTGETEHGVLISADLTPVTAYATPMMAADVAADVASDVASNAPAHVTFHTTTRVEQPLPWFVVLVAAGGGFFAGAGIVALGLAARRRRAMRPRANDLRIS